MVRPRSPVSGTSQIGFLCVRREAGAFRSAAGIRGGAANSTVHRQPAFFHPPVLALDSAKNRAASAPNPPRRAPCIVGLAGKSAARPGLRGRRVSELGPAGRGHLDSPEMLEIRA